MGPQIPEETKETFHQHLSSYNLWSLTGIYKYMFLKIELGVIHVKAYPLFNSLLCVTIQFSKVHLYVFTCCR